MLTECNSTACDINANRGAAIVDYMWQIVFNGARLSLAGLQHVQLGYLGTISSQFQKGGQL